MHVIGSYCIEAKRDGTGLVANVFSIQPVAKITTMPEPILLGQLQKSDWFSGD